MTEPVDDPISEEEDELTGSEPVEEEDVIEEADGALDDDEDLRDEVDAGPEPA